MCKRTMIKWYTGIFTINSKFFIKFIANYVSFCQFCQISKNIQSWIQAKQCEQYDRKLNSPVSD